jgi:hypothetical protein
LKGQKYQISSELSGKSSWYIFSQFEKVTADSKWSKDYWCTLLQSVFVWKTAQDYSALAIYDRSDYDKIKAVILKAYGLVSEGYRQRLNIGNVAIKYIGFCYRKRFIQSVVNISESWQFPELLQINLGRRM